MAIGRCRIAVLLGPRIAVLPDTHLTGWIRSELNDVGERDRSESPRTGLKKPQLPTLRAPGLPASNHYRVVVRPPGAATALLLAQADGEHQMAAVRNQFAGRIGLFLRLNDFGNAFERLHMGGVEFVTEPGDASYGRVVVFLDVSGNRWDLLGPRPSH